MKIFKVRDKCVRNVSEAEHMGIVGTLLHVFSRQKTFAMWPYNEVKSVKRKLFWTGALFSFCSHSLNRLNGTSHRAHVLLILNASQMHSARSLHTRVGSCRNNWNKRLSTHTTRILETFIHNRLVVYYLPNSVFPFKETKSFRLFAIEKWNVFCRSFSFQSFRGNAGNFAYFGLMCAVDVEMGPAFTC